MLPRAGSHSSTMLSPAAMLNSTRYGGYHETLLNAKLNANLNAKLKGQPTLTSTPCIQFPEYTNEMLSADLRVCVMLDFQGV